MTTGMKVKVGSWIKDKRQNNVQDQVQGTDNREQGTQTTFFE